MDDYLEFSNVGEVPVNAFKLLGASSKRNDSTKIGYFGTGLKYALAVLLREGIDFVVYSGGSEIKIGTRKSKFLDQVVTVITVNGEKTSITIEAGINWETWFAIREIYSNNLDENGTMKLVTSVTPEAGTTKIYIQRNEKLKDLIDNWSDYFSNTRSVLSTHLDGSTLLQKNNAENLTVFRRGIRAYTNRSQSIFDYDVKNLKINESRVAEHDYEARQRCAEVLATCDNLEALNHFIHTRGDFIEKDTNFWTYIFDDSAGAFSETWYEALKDSRIVPEEYSGFYGVTQSSVILPERLCKHLYKQFKDRLNIMGSSKEAYLVIDKPVDFMLPALTRLASVGFDFPIEDIKIAKFKDGDVQGMADTENGLILLSEVLEEMDDDKRTAILFEEIAHSKSGHSDNTRAFQDYIISLAVALIPVPRSV